MFKFIILVNNISKTYRRSLLLKLGIALSGGGIRGIAHAGVLKALEDYGIKIDVIGGCSSGSMIASLYAMGYTPEYIYFLFKRYAKDIAALNTKPIISGIRSYFFGKKKIVTGFKDGEPIELLCNKLALKKGIKNITQIPMPIVIPSVDITESKEYVFTNHIPKKAKDSSQYITEISVGKAVRASSSFPAIFSPCSIGTHAFMDGGALDNIPVHEVKKQGADKVIAVKFDSDPINEESNVMDIVMKTIDIMGSKIAEESLEMSDFVLNVYTDKVGLLDTQKLDSCYQYGYQSVVKNMEEIKEICKE